MGIARASVKMEVLVTAKAYPTVSNTYGEAGCVAGKEQKFATYEVIRLRAHKHA